MFYVSAPNMEKYLREVYQVILSSPVKIQQFCSVFHCFVVWVQKYLNQHFKFLSSSVTTVLVKEFFVTFLVHQIQDSRPFTPKVLKPTVSRELSAKPQLRNNSLKKSDAFPKLEYKSPLPLLRLWLKFIFWLLQLVYFCCRLGKTGE